MTAKHFKATHELTKEQNARTEERRSLNRFEAKVANTEEAHANLSSQVAMLEATKKRNEELLIEKEAELEDWREKDAYFQKVQNSLAAGKAGDSEIDGSMRMMKASPFMDQVLQLRKELSGKRGNEMGAMMKQLKISEKTLIDWTNRPTQLVKGITRLYYILRVKTFSNCLPCIFFSYGSSLCCSI